MDLTLEQVLELKNVTRSQFDILTTLPYSSILGRDRATRLPPLSRTSDEYKAVLEECIANGWVQVLDSKAIDEVFQSLSGTSARFLRNVPPPIGEIDFTASGALLTQSIMQAVIGDDWGDAAYSESQYTVVRFYFRSYRLAAQTVDFWRRRGEYVTDPYAIGPVRLFWWELLPVAFYVETWGYPDEIPARHEPDHLQDLLDRAQVSRAEWQLLEAVGSQERIWHQTAEKTIAYRSRTHPLGQVSDQILQEAMVSCLWKGLVQILDRETASRIRNAVTEDHVPGPVADFSVHRVQFTEAGARMFIDLSEAIYGSDWAFRVPVKEEVYNRIGVVCPTQRQAMRMERLWRDDQNFKYCQTREIGPWRPYWWLSFPHGYMLDCVLEAGLDINGARVVRE
jgi:hypothetical protein